MTIVTIDGQTITEQQAKAARRTSAGEDGVRYTTKQEDVDKYWTEAALMRDERRLAKKEGRPITEAMFLREQPPIYVPKDASAPPQKEPPTIPRIATYIDDAKKAFNFVPERVSEFDFKKQYALHALQSGLTRKQIVGIYNFETGGNGTADLQSGLKPYTGEGTPLSTAVGYSQLLAANSAIMMADHGAEFADKLEKMGKKDKAELVRRMQADAAKVPKNWSDYLKFAKTEQGRAMHMANLDGDIGPMMQIRKVQNLVDYAKQNGIPEPTPAELEAMNLAGRDNGLLLRSHLKDLPAANVFMPDGYRVNPVVHNRTGGQLIERIGTIMQGSNSKQPGSLQFQAAFNAAQRELGLPVSQEDLQYDKYKDLPAEPAKAPAAKPAEAKAAPPPP